MKHYLGFLFFALSFGLLTLAAEAQDGLLFSAQPPLVFRSDGLKVYFTNTSDQILHGITLHNDNKGEKTSTVIIDTIEPHKTAMLEWNISVPVSEPTVTCTNYSKPLSLKNR